MDKGEDFDPECPQDCDTPEEENNPAEEQEEAEHSFEEADEDVHFRRQVSATNPFNTRDGMAHQSGGLRRPHPPPTFGFKPEPYDGESDWDEYVIHFETYAMYMDWDPRTSAVMLGFCLRGPARSVLAGLSPAQRLDYVVLKNALTQNFSPREQVHLHQAELKSRIRRPDESLTTLGRDIARLVRLAYPTADVNTRETIGINAFLDALPGSALEIRLHVVKGRPLTLQQAIAYAMEVDAVLEAEARRGHAPRRGNVRMVSDDEALQVPQDLKAMRLEVEAALKELKAEKAKPRLRTPMADITCFRCGKKGHMKKDCRVRSFKKVPYDGKVERSQGNENEHLDNSQ